MSQEEVERVHNKSTARSGNNNAQGGNIMMSIVRDRWLLFATLILAGLYGTGSARADSLYIGDGEDNTVKRFDAQTGAYLGVFDAPGSGLLGPRGLIFTRGSLYVSNQNVGQPFAGEILQFRRTTGDFLDALVPCNPPGRACDAHGPFAPRGLISGLGATLYVADLGDFPTPLNPDPPPGRVP